MFWDIVRFELTYRFRRPAVYLFAGMFFALTFGAIATDSMQMGGAIGNAARNSPFEIVRLLSMMSVMGLLALTGFVATAVNRDYEYRTSEFFFATPVSKTSYLIGRFIGSLITAIAAVSAAAFGIMLASQMPWLDPERVLPFDARPYAYSLVVFVLPNLFCVGALLYTFASLSRKVLYTYVVMLAFLALWGTGHALLRDLDNTFIAPVIDPFGVSALDLATRYWTVVERNTLLPPMDAAFIVNRLLWLAVGAGLLVFAVARFRMAVAEQKTREVAGAQGDADAAPLPGTPPDWRDVAGAASAGGGLAVALPRVALDFSWRSRVAQLVEQTRAEVGAIVRSVPFLVILIFGVFNLLGSLITEVEGATSYPVTRLMVSMIEGTYTIFLFIFLLVYAGQLVWRERGLQMHEIQGSLPTPDWVPMVAKLAGLLVVAFAALALAMLVTIAFQAANGYFNFEIGVYLRGIFLVQMPAWYLVAVLAIAAQVFTNNKVAGFAIMVIFFVLQEVVGTIGLEHNLWFYGETPRAIYSDMNGYGHFVQPLVWFFLYWGLVAAVLLVLSELFWVRGTDVRGLGRWSEARRRMTRPWALGLAASVAGAIVVGGWIFYNTNVLNEFTTEKTENRRAALLEERYKQYEDLPQPRVTDVKMAVDIHPHERRVEVHGDLRLANKTDRPIDELHMVIDRRLEIDDLVVRLDPNPGVGGLHRIEDDRSDLGGGSASDATIRMDDREVGYRIYDLGRTLEPGGALAVRYDARIENPGFENDRSNTRVVENGTFLDTDHTVPVFGYTDRVELDDAHERKKYGLPEMEDMPGPDDPVALGNTITSDADWVTYEATLSTSADQIALTAGYLEREWEEDGRRYFHYVMDVPILHFYPFVSGRYEVARDHWRDVPVEVYYHPRHPYNVDRMIDSAKLALEYYTKNYGPFQHHAIRIVEFPRYERFAQSFPTIIPFSESAHFVDDLSDPETNDMICYITAHEIAHQWWGHQVAAAWTRGGYFVEESLAQYSAAMVMEQDLGPARMEKVLKYELDRYLRGRGRAREEELPLMLCEYQPYLYYGKGSLVMYALRDYIGEERLNAGLRAYVQENAFRGPPYPNPVDLVAAMRGVTPEEYQYLIEDFFETITLYDNRCEKATCEKAGDGTYRVTLDVRSRKLRADGHGVETEIPHEDWIEIGVYGEEGEGGEEAILYMEKHRLASGDNAIELVVDGKPVRAGVDPRHLLIDRVPEDNMKHVSS